MTFHDAQIILKKTLGEIYESREAAVIADWVLEKITGLKKIDRLVHRDVPLGDSQIRHFNDYSVQLSAHRPVQYVIQEAEFCGYRLFVDERVLIPRPETEELVQWIMDDEYVGARKDKLPATVLDVGTGSGAIPIVLKKKFPSWQVAACDVSIPALEVARKNAAQLNVGVDFFECDILDTSRWPGLPTYDIIVSNPPYIPGKDKTSMRKNVLDYEPHLALFTPNDDAFVFYQEIADFGKLHLSKGGRLYFEIHHEGVDAITAILRSAGYGNIETRKDLFGNFRMIKAEPIR